MLTKQIEAFLAAEAAAADAPAADGEALPTEPPPTVFVVDDDRASRDDLRDCCAEHGCNGETFASGEAFLAAYRPGQRVPGDRCPDAGHERDRAAERLRPRRGCRRS